MNEYDARGGGEDNLGRSGVFLGCVWRCHKLEMSRFRVVMQSNYESGEMERAKAKVCAGRIGDRKVLVRGAKRMNRMMIRWRVVEFGIMRVIREVGVDPF